MIREMRKVGLTILLAAAVAITATPSAVQFSMVRVGEKKELSVVVKGDKPFKILDVKGGDGLITAAAPISGIATTTSVPCNGIIGTRSGVIHHAVAISAPKVARAKTASTRPRVLSFLLSSTSIGLFAELLARWCSGSMAVEVSART